MCGDGGVLAVVKDAAGTRGGAELQEIDADPIAFRPDDVLGANACLAGLIG